MKDSHTPQVCALNAHLGWREHFHIDFGLTINSIYDQKNIEVINGGGHRLTIEGD